MIYADTNFLVLLYVQQAQTPVAERLLKSLGSRRLPIPHLLYLELVNAVEQCVFASRRGREPRVSPQLAALYHSLILEDLQSALIVVDTPVSESQARRMFELLAMRHTAQHGFRAYDVLHVAQALVLGCDTFWSFDAKARKLAVLEGLKVNPLV